MTIADGIWWRRERNLWVSTGVAVCRSWMGGSSGVWELRCVGIVVMWYVGVVVCRSCGV